MKGRVSIVMSLVAVGFLAVADYSFSQFFSIFKFWVLMCKSEKMG